MESHDAMSDFGHFESAAREQQLRKDRTVSKEYTEVEVFEELNSEIIEWMTDPKGTPPTQAPRSDCG
jgi:hypothetical protein